MAPDFLEHHRHCKLQLGLGVAFTREERIIRTKSREEAEAFELIVKVQLPTPCPLELEPLWQRYFDNDLWTDPRP